ncbi:MAG: protein phosphatase 2C domain-containing protein [Prevotella sp.]|nr:protein phosphatase 2C domain-containing protein [Prevotella sp.]
MRIKAFITHKDQEQFSDCQDRFRVNKDTKSIALADGMSQSIFQKIWAQLLVDTYTTIEQWEPTIDSVRELAPQWQERVKAIIPNLMPAAQRRSKNSLAKGMSAGSTFVGVRFNENKWEGWVLGDSCLIVIDKNNKIEKIETSQEGQFDSHPDYFDSNPIKEGKGQPKPINGTLLQGEKLLLVSDPFSDILYDRQCTEIIKDIVSELLTVKNHENFEAVVAKWRKQGMHNDDSTLVVVEYDETDDFHIDYEDSIDVFIEMEKQQESFSEPSSVPNGGNSDNENTSEPLDVIENDNEECKTLKDYLSEVADSFIDSLPTEIKKKKKKVLKAKFKDKLSKALDCYYKIEEK